MADGYGFFYMGSDGGGTSRSKTDDDVEDFDEEDVWAVVMKERKDISPKVVRRTKDSFVGSSRRILPTASRMIPRTTTQSGSGGRVVHQSAPVNIPDWSKIYRKKNDRYDDGHGHGHGHDDVVNGDGGDNHDDDDDDGDDDGDKIPPHEWIAKKLARSQISSFSVCEGVGRTLKGRDLSKVRNAVLTRTGFLE